MIEGQSVLPTAAKNVWVKITSIVSATLPGSGQVYSRHLSRQWRSLTFLRKADPMSRSIKDAGWWNLSWPSAGIHNKCCVVVSEKGSNGWGILPALWLALCLCLEPLAALAQDSASAPTMYLKASIAPVPRDVLVRPPWTSQVHMVHINTCRQNTRINILLKGRKKKIWENKGSCFKFNTDKTAKHWKWLESVY